jgi:hypothetical protein
MLKLLVNKAPFSLLLFFTLVSGWSSLHAQKNAQIIDWKFLSQVEFKDKYFAEYEAWYLVPVFGDKVKALDGQQIMIKGYLIPMDVEGGKYALSAYPFSACFFCGGAGPETVISLQFDEKPARFETDEYLTFTGKLKLNSSDFDDFSYILQAAKPLKK